jgi:hypothetical protein
VDGVLDGDSIAVEVLSATYPDSSPGTRVTFSSDQVGLEIGHDPNQPPVAQLGGTDSATAVNGVASFVPGPSIDLHGLDYTLLATNPNMTSAESGQPRSGDLPRDGFDISDAVGECAKGQCNNLHTNGDTINADLSSTSTEGIIAMSIGVLPELECPGYVPNSQQQAVTVLPLGVTSTSTMTVEITVLADIVDRPASQYLICWASTKSFTERDGTAADAVTISGDPFYQGLLPDCANRNPVLPCQVTPSKQDKQGNVHLTARAPGDDPHAR